MTTNLRPILKNKYYLYLTEFFAGVSVMAVELGASRLLAPYFSSSQIVWTIIIGTIMIAMALGNLWGGRTADKDPNTDRLYRRILVAAVWIAAIPVVGKYIILGISGLLVLTINTNFLIVAAFCTCMVHLRLPPVSAGDGDALAGQIQRGQPGGQRQDRRHPGGVQHHREHLRDVSADLCDHPGGGHGGDVPALLRHPAGHRAYLFSQLENPVEEVPGLSGSSLRPVPSLATAGALPSGPTT